MIRSCCGEEPCHRIQPSRDIVSVRRLCVQPCRRCSEMVLFQHDEKEVLVVTNVIDGDPHPCVDP